MNVPLSELTRVRLRCRGKLHSGDPCFMTYELPVAKLADGLPDDCCPVCKRTYRYERRTTDPQPHQDKPLRNLGAAMTAIANMRDAVELEFIFPQE
jgi:hypothetical protein